MNSSRMSTDRICTGWGAGGVWCLPSPKSVCVGEGFGDQVPSGWTRCWPIANLWGLPSPWLGLGGGVCSGGDKFIWSSPPPPHPLSDSMTNKCENITFDRFNTQVGKICLFSIIISVYLADNLIFYIICSALVKTTLILHKHITISVEEWNLKNSVAHNHVKLVDQYIP